MNVVIFGKMYTLVSRQSGLIFFLPETFAKRFLTSFQEKSRTFRVGEGGDFPKYIGFIVWGGGS